MKGNTASIPLPTGQPDKAAHLAAVEQERLLAASVELGGGQFRTELIVPDMHCAGCLGKVERGLCALAGVVSARANLSLKNVTVIWHPDRISSGAITQALEGLGFTWHLGDLDEEGQEHQRRAGKMLLLALAVAGFSAANIMLLSVSVWSGADAETAKLFHLVSGLIAVPTVAFSGQPFFRSALAALAGRRLNMDVPISLAVLLALGMSLYESLNGGQEAYFDACVTLLFFLLIGRYLDHLMRDKARSAVDRLYSLAAKSGILVGADGTISHLALADIRPGMVLRVHAGERFPVDGKIVCGSTDIDRSHVTGESEPVSVVPGDRFEAGCLSLTGSVDIRACSDNQGSFLGEMRRMMQAAEQGRGVYLRIADRMAQIYAPAVHLLAFLAFAGWMIHTGGDWHTSLYVAIAVLIITCPCALGLAVPVAHVIAANRLMNNGVLLRDGGALERLGECDMVVFDKTGTLTSGNPRISHADLDPDAPRCAIKALASRSLHPAALAVAEGLKETKPAAIEQVSEHPGCGVEGIWRGRRVRLGRPDWVEEISGAPGAKHDDWSVAFAVEGGGLSGFVVTDRLRNGAEETIAGLRKYDLSIQMLSGDHADNVAAIARRLAVTSWKARQTPGDKIRFIEEVSAQGGKPLMVGDGINDGPALAAGHVSMVPASASDVGRHSADFVFIRENLSAVLLALEVSRKTARVVRQNFAIAIAYNCVAVPLAMAGYVTPLIAAIAMSASSIIVVANSFRISFSGGPGKPLDRRIEASEPRFAETVT